MLFRNLDGYRDLDMLHVKLKVWYFGKLGGLWLSAPASPRYSNRTIVPDFRRC